MIRRPTRIVLFASLLVLGLAAPAGAAGAAPSFVDTQVKANVLLLRGYIDEYAIENAFTYPPAAIVKKGGGLVAPIWPANPWTGRTMVPGRSRGSYTYSLTATGYRLVGHLSRGTYKVTGGLPSWLRDERDTASKIGVELLGKYIDQFVSGNGNRPPAASQVSAGDAVGIQGGGVPIWPISPWTGTAMTLGTAPGQFSYTVNGTSYSLSVRLAGGTSWTVPGH